VCRRAAHLAGQDRQVQNWFRAAVIFIEIGKVSATHREEYSPVLAAKRSRAGSIVGQPAIKSSREGARLFKIYVVNTGMLPAIGALAAQRFAGQATAASLLLARRTLAQRSNQASSCAKQ
jgi:hypothetical protein